MNNRLISIVIMCLLVIAGLLGFITFEANVVKASNIIYVGTGLGNDTTSIQDAIDNFAILGDTVYVHSGTYFEYIWVNKTINLTGEDKETTIIDGGGFGDMVNITADWVNMSFFTVTNGGDGIGLDDVSNCRVSNCIVSNIMDFGIGSHGLDTSNKIVNNSVSNCYLGIHISYSSNNTVKNNNVSLNFYGIYLESASYNTITNNYVSMNNGNGIYIESSSNNTISMNEVFNNNYGMHIRESSNYNFISDNNISNCTINGIYLSKLSNNNVMNNKISNSGGNGIYLFSASNLTLIGNRLTNNSYGIYLTSSSKNNTLVSNNISNNDYGIRLGLSFNNTIIDNDVYLNNFDGIRLYSSSKNNTIMDNKVTSNDRHGILLNLSSSNNQIINNDILNNIGDGIHLSESSDNIITKNNISLNVEYGINLSSSSIDNKIYHNNFIGNNNSNSPQVLDASNNGNIWDDGYPSGGNYWSDFDEPSDGAYDDYVGQNQNISGNDGIVDNGTGGGGGKNPYFIDGDSKDQYPLIDPVDKTPPTITNLLPPDASTINVSTPTISASYSDFSGINTSSVMLKVDNLDETPNATVTASDVTYTPTLSLPDGSHTIYLEVKDIWNHSAIVLWSFIVDTTPPAAITDLSTSNITNESITLSWTAPGDDGSTGTAAGYKIKYSTSGPITDSNWASAATYPQSWTPLNAGNTETHVISGLTPGTQYWFAIKAYDDIFNYAEISNSPDDITLNTPSAPQNLQISSGDRFVNITWEAPYSDGGSPIIGYNIHRDDYRKIYDNISATQLWYNDSLVAFGVTYKYNISAVNEFGEGPVSINISITPMTVPKAPRNLLVESGDGYVNLTWDAPVATGGSPIEKYRIYRDTTLGGDTPLVEIGIVLFYNDTSVTNGITYYYKVSCVNDVGESPYSNEVNATPDKDTDGDGILDSVDWDDDDDGYLDEYDDFPLNASEWIDTDGDGIGNNADPDDDDDGYDDDEDFDPLDPNIWKEPKEPPSDTTWIWFLVLAIIIVCVVVLILFLRKRSTKPEEKSEHEDEEGKASE